MPEKLERDVKKDVKQFRYKVPRGPGRRFVLHDSSLCSYELFRVYQRRFFQPETFLKPENGLPIKIQRACKLYLA